MGYSESVQLQTESDNECPLFAPLDKVPKRLDETLKPSRRFTKRSPKFALADCAQRGWLAV